MSYDLRPDLSFCRVDDHLIFLDIRNDRYFRLSSGLARAFTEHVESGACSDADLRKLIEHGVLVEGSQSTKAAPSTSIEWPLRSAVENAPTRISMPFKVLLEVFAITCFAQARLKTSRLEWTLSALAAYRLRKARRMKSAPEEAYEVRLASAATAFLQARPYVPISTCCLIDSISMIYFLAKHGMPANLVFGVAGAPFSAHCWVQAGALVLNDTLGNTHAHTPIKVV